MDKQDKYSSKFLLSNKVCDSLTSQRLRYSTKISSNRFGRFPQLSYGNGNISDAFSNEIDKSMMQKISTDPLYIVTHSGRFHADEVLATSVVCAAFNSAFYSYGSAASFRDNYSVSNAIDTFGPIILRTRSKDSINELRSKNEPVIVFDIGGEFDPDNLLFDHHQKDGAGKRDCRDISFNSNQDIEYATFGLAWRYFAKTVISKVLLDMLNYRVKCNNPLFNNIAGIKYKHSNVSSRKVNIDTVKKVSRDKCGTYINVPNFIGFPYKVKDGPPALSEHISNVSVSTGLFTSTDTLRYVSFIRKACSFIQTQCEPDEKFSNLISSLDWKDLSSYIIAANAIILHKFEEILSIITDEVFTYVEDFLVAPIDMNDVGDKRCKAKYSVYNFSSIILELNESKDLDRDAVLDYIDCFNMPPEYIGSPNGVDALTAKTYANSLEYVKSCIVDSSTDNSFSYAAELGFNMIRTFVSKSILQAMFVMSPDHYTIHDSDIVEIHNNELSLRWNSLKTSFPRSTKFVVVSSPSNSDESPEDSKIIYRAYSFNRNFLFPVEWWGLPTDSLKSVSGCESATFCHQTGFTIGADTYEDIMKMCRIASGTQSNVIRKSGQVSFNIGASFEISDEERLKIISDLNNDK